MTTYQFHIFLSLIVNDKKHLTLVSHTNGVVIVEESGCIIDLDFQSLGSIFELADLGNTYTIKDCDEIESLKSNNNELTKLIEFLKKQLTNSDNRITELRNQITGLDNELNTRGERISQLNNEIETLKADNCKETVQYNELYNRNEYLEKKLTISQDSITALEESNVRYKEAIVDKDDIIKRQSGEIARLDKIIEEKTNSLIKLENVEDTLNATVKINEELNTQLSCAKEDIDKRNKQLEEKTSQLAERTHTLRVFRQALYDMRLYVQPYKEYELDFEWLTIRNSIDSGFFIRFKDIASASRAIGDCRYYISLKDVLDKYENDIVDFNVSAMDIYYIHKASPNVVRKFNYDNFNISCKDQRTANTINTLLNCSNISVYDIMDRFKDDIAYSNTH